MNELTTLRKEKEVLKGRESDLELTVKMNSQNILFTLLNLLLRKKISPLSLNGDSVFRARIVRGMMLAILENDKLKHVLYTMPDLSLWKLFGQEDCVDCWTLWQMKCCKASGLSGVAAKMMRATVNLGVELTR